MSSPRRASGRRRSRPQVERLHGRHVIAAALGAGRRRLDRLLVRAGGVPRDLEPVIERAVERGLPVVTLAGPELADLAGTDEVGLQGVVLEAGPLPVLSSIDDLVAQGAPGGPGRRGGAASWVVAMDGVEDPRNLGAVARVAEAAGATGLLVTDRRSPPLGSAATRASAGALERLPVCRIPNLARGLAALKGAGRWVVAAEASAETSLYAMPDRLLAGDLVVVLGAEGRGLRPSIVAAADHLVRIPMAGEVASLNVATAASVVLFELVRRSAAPGRSCE